jgi:hypothetical protein
MSAATSGVTCFPHIALRSCWRWFGNLPAVDRSKTFAGSSACAGSKVEQQFAASGAKQRQMTLAEIEQAKHAASWLNSLATNLATTGAIAPLIA